MTQQTRALLTRFFIITISLSLLTGFGPFRDKKTADEERQEVLDMRDEVLAMLYEEVPRARENVETASGYAVFSNIGVNLLLVSTANGSGIAHNNETGEDTYMKMYSAGVGVGYGVKDFRAVFVFKTQEALNEFIHSGWAANAQADAAAVSGDKGEAVDYEIAIAPDVFLYQFTESGLALQATIQGTRYLPDEDLN